MIFGIGTDLVKVERMEKSLASPAFCRRVFGPEEQLLLASLGQKHRAESAAACFAAKEAFLKCCKTGLGGFALAEIQALRSPEGAPYYALSGQAQEFCQKQQLTASLSLSHEGGFAMAFAILEKRP